MTQTFIITIDRTSNHADKCPVSETLCSTENSSGQTPFRTPEILSDLTLYGLTECEINQIKSTTV
jgi:hypothetical protein